MTERKSSIGKKRAISRYVQGCLWTLIIGILLVVGLVVQFQLSCNSQMKRGKAFATIHLGDSTDMIFSAFGGRPDATVDFRGYSIMYYFGRFPGISKRGEVPEKVVSLRELPWYYDAIQLMISPAGRLVAKGWCGEATHVETEEGPIKGSDLSVLDGVNDKWK